MSIYLSLFFTFLKIGAVSFGGGYGMISLIKEDCLSNHWLTEEEFLNFIAVSESTPGPVAVNIATFVGSHQGGLLGAFFATLGVILPSFIIILLISTVIKNLLNYKGVRVILDSVKPAIIGLILSTAIIMTLSMLFNIDNFHSVFLFDWRGLVVFGVLTTAYVLYFKIKKRAISPIVLILLSGIVGVCIF